MADIVKRGGIRRRPMPDARRLSFETPAPAAARAPVRDGVVVVVDHRAAGGADPSPRGDR